MATIPRTFLITEKGNIPNISPKNGQIIAAYDSDEVWYDAPNDGTRDGDPVRRKISGVKVVETLPDNPMEGIVYVRIGNDEGYIPGSDSIHLYDMRVWVNDQWYIVGTNKDDSCVKSSVVVNDKFYLVGSAQAAESVGPLWKNANIFIQNGVINGSFKGDLEGTASNATVAARANADNAATPKPITNYLYNVATNPASPASIGSTITFTLGNGNTKSINIQDTRYEVFTQNAAVPGLVNGTATTVGSDSTGLLLSGSGWIALSNINFPTVDKAEKDASGQVITATYVKDATWDDVTRELTLQYGDDTFGNPIIIPDTTYGEVTTSNAGLAPALPTSAATTKYLRGDKQWATLPVFKASGNNSGLVPDAASGDANKFLKGDGTWGGTFGAGTDGLVPGPTSADHAASLRGDGTWDVCPDTKNTAGATNDVANRLYVVGATAQTSNPVTNSNQNVYIDGNHVYSNNKQVVNVSDTQTLSNKLFSITGLSSPAALGTASVKSFIANIDPDDPNIADTLPTTGAVLDYVPGAAQEIVNDSLGGYVPTGALAPMYDEAVSWAISDMCMYTDPLEGIQIYECIAPTTGAFDSTKWSVVSLQDLVGRRFRGTLTAGSTSMTFSHSAIAVGAIPDVKTSVFGLQPTAVSVTAGQISLTFAAQASDVNVLVSLF